jgi:hypothetical protein
MLLQRVCHTAYNRIRLEQSGFIVQRHMLPIIFGGTYCLYLQDRGVRYTSNQLCFLVAGLTYSSTLKMEAEPSSDTSLNFHRTQLC